MGIDDKISDSEDKDHSHDQMNACKCKLMELLAFDPSLSVGLLMQDLSLCVRWLICATVVNTHAHT